MLSRLSPGVADIKKPTDRAVRWAWGDESWGGELRGVLGNC
jgi:hypothetical protein